MIDYENALNKAQYQAVSCNEKSVLVVAGAGSGKTRTIIYRLAWLVEHGVDPNRILLLTFTRKAANEMLARAENLLGADLYGLSGGTFHSFAFNSLKKYPPLWLGSRNFTMIDPADVAQTIKLCKENLKLGKKDSSFPKAQTIADILSKARNKEISVMEVMQRESFHLLPYAEDVEKIGEAYAAFRREKCLLDYDDLLFEVENLLKSDESAARNLRKRYEHILVDEYQDTNLVQARIVRLLTMGDDRDSCASIMAVGDEAQSIYAFRGANVRNILDFPKLFPGARTITLEENYRSAQPILNVANSILDHAEESFHKSLFTERKDGELAKVISAATDATQAILVARRIEELLSVYQPHEIAVLFRSGFHSYLLENILRKSGISYRKYGGIKFTEAAHIKDMLAFGRLVLNPMDLPAFSRIAAMHKGIGPKTTERLYQLMIAAGSENGSENGSEKLDKALKKYQSLKEDLDWIFSMKEKNASPEIFFGELLEFYRPRLEELYPEDWPSRIPGLEEIAQIAREYDNLDLFMADMALETPATENEDPEDCVILSTVHSAKGLEWKAVLLLDMVEDRFPSRHALARPEDFEEERRLFYVACTRARDILEMYAPARVFSRQEQCNIRAAQSPFLREFGPDCVERYKEKMSGELTKTDVPDNEKQRIFSLIGTTRPPNGNTGAAYGADKASGYCRHKIFGRGKIVKKIDAEKLQVNFQGFGLKTILTDYLILED